MEKKDKQGQRERIAFKQRVFQSDLLTHVRHKEKETETETERVEEHRKSMCVCNSFRCAPGKSRRTMHGDRIYF